MNRASSPRAAAFTLLEVMAAVALLGILYTTLAGVAAAWLRSEGESRWRFEASLAADRRLAEIEAQVAAGTVPELGEDVAEEDPFRITTRVEEFALPIELFEPAVPVAKSREESAQAAAGSTLFPRQGEKVQSPLRLIEIFVAWDEGDEQRRVERTTLAFDRAAASAVLASLPRRRDAARGQGAEGGQDAKRGKDASLPQNAPRRQGAEPSQEAPGRQKTPQRQDAPRRKGAQRQQGAQRRQGAP